MLVCSLFVVRLETVVRSSSPVFSRLWRTRHSLFIYLENAMTTIEPTITFDFRKALDENRLKGICGLRQRQGPRRGRLGAREDVYVFAFALFC